MTATVQIEGLEELLAELEKRGTEARKVLAPLAREGGRLIMGEADGRTHRSIAKALRVTTAENKKDAVEVVVHEGRDKGSMGFVGWFLEYGTAPHEIRPKNAKALYIGGRFVKVIKHPGSAPQPFMRPAFDTKAGAASDIVTDGVKKALGAD